MSYDTNPYVLMSRAKYLHLNDPRCYNGAYFDAEMRWSGWETLDRLPNAEAAARKLKFWRELNDYAVSQRGEDSRREFKIVEQEEVVA
jgi:hypothetical protein